MQKEKITFEAFITGKSYRNVEPEINPLREELEKELTEAILAENVVDKFKNWARGEVDTLVTEIIKSDAFQTLIDNVIKKIEINIRAK